MFLSHIEDSLSPFLSLSKKTIIKISWSEDKKKINIYIYKKDWPIISLYLPHELESITSLCLSTFPLPPTPEM